MARVKSREDQPRHKMSIRRDDQVLVTTGKDRGKRGRVIQVIPREDRVVIDGINIVKRHLRRQPNSLQAGIIDKPAPLSRSNVMLVCPNCDHPTRVSRTELPNGSRVRVCKQCGEIIDKEA